MFQKISHIGKKNDNAPDAIAKFTLTSVILRHDNLQVLILLIDITQTRQKNPISRLRDGVFFAFYSA